MDILYLAATVALTLLVCGLAHACDKLGRPPMSLTYWAVGLAAIAVLGYLVVALLQAENL